MTSLARGARYKDGFQWLDKPQNAQVFTQLYLLPVLPTLKGKKR